ncbi:MAG: GGDEF domain-containing protein, partial [Thalassotalea sp.]|nr:GGDEF domain-containing protein [Thalassotalea sp.]
GIQACRKVCSNNEIIGRMGGDEFAILMTEQSLAEMKSLANKILQTFQQLDTSKVSYRFDSNCSIGVADTQTSGYHLRQLLNDADIALRTAKAQGKNRLVHVIDT